MLFGLGSTEIVLMVMVALAVGSGLLALLLPFLDSNGAVARIKSVVSEPRRVNASSQPRSGRVIEGKNDNRRKQIKETLKQADARANKRKGLPLRLQISRAGLSISVLKFWLISVGCGVLFFLIPLLIGFPTYVGALSAIAATFGLPRWFLSTLANRRQKIFREELADAVDVMVRGLKAGLPLSDAMKIIATESGPPIGPEFMEVVDGQRLGITIDQGLERMFDRMPIPEVSFLGIVIGIQSKTGGNLSETLGNLSRVLRDRKKLKAKVRSMSQEAKSSAAIIGAIPFLIIGALLLISPGYLDPLLSTTNGHLILAGAGVWMLIGVLIMRSMINFDI
ncbi:MAG: type II secretion system F family protein [Aestuariivirga sp.]|uniref:type II secretion system F family protein n=1 Tax=Aestuariivirga sp. TaxID=2650926 RepID=UPI0025BB542A|nr:type II secretion system F family protein [Aestuariivirga sp.]MCA3561952.1 type II secretion system F family protein [Aestuariivirga sp.]